MRETREQVVRAPRYEKNHAERNMESQLSLARNELIRPEKSLLRASPELAMTHVRLPNVADVGGRMRGLPMILSVFLSMVLIIAAIGGILGSLGLGSAGAGILAGIHALLPFALLGVILLTAGWLVFGKLFQ